MVGVYPGNRGPLRKRIIAEFLMQENPQEILSVAKELVKCLPYMDDLQLMKLMPPLKKESELLPEEEGKLLKEMLYSDFRREFCTRIKNTTGYSVF